SSLFILVFYFRRRQRRRNTPPIKHQGTDGSHQGIPWRGNPAAPIGSVAADERHDENEDKITDEPIARRHVVPDPALELRILVDKGKIENDGGYNHRHEQRYDGPAAPVDDERRGDEGERGNRRRTLEQERPVHV